MASNIFREDDVRSVVQNVAQVSTWIVGDVYTRKSSMHGRVIGCAFIFLNMNTVCKMVFVNLKNMIFDNNICYDTIINRFQSISKVI